MTVQVPTRDNADLGALLTFAAAGLGTTVSPMQENLAARGLIIVVDITAITGTTPTLIVTVKGHDNASGKDYTILTSAALAAVATTVLQIEPGIVAAANLAANAALPLLWSVTAVIGGTTPAVTATIGANVVH